MNKRYEPVYEKWTESIWRMLADVIQMPILFCFTQL